MGEHNSDYGFTSSPLLKSLLFLAKYILWEVTRAIFPIVLLSFLTSLILHRHQSRAPTAYLSSILTVIAGLAHTGHHGQDGVVPGCDDSSAAHL